MAEEWGPWIEHDGKGCPCVGEYVHREHEGPTHRFFGPKNTILSGNFAWGIAVPGHSWSWSPGWNPVIRYRIRKPRALLDLIERAKELDDAPEGPVRVTDKPKVGA